MKPIWHTLPSLEDLNGRYKIGLIKHLDIEYVEAGADFISAKMPVDERTAQVQGLLHGGATCALAETIGSVAAYFCVDPTQKYCLGLDINVNHIKAVPTGTFVIATARPFHIGKTTHVWDIQVRNEAGKLVAVSRLTVAVLNK